MSVNPLLHEIVALTQSASDHILMSKYQSLNWKIYIKLEHEIK